MAKKGNKVAQANLSLILEKEGNLKEAEIWVRKSAQQDFNFGQYTLARMLEKQEKTKEAKIWYKKAIKKL